MKMRGKKKQAIKLLLAKIEPVLSDKVPSKVTTIRVSANSINELECIFLIYFGYVLLDKFIKIPENEN
jgi:hypothetical protein